MAYRLTYGLLYGLSLLPLWVLYILTDFIYVLVYYVFGYRKQVVLENLAIAFPEKTLSERKKIARKFYRNFTDFFAETMKLISASDAFVNRHFTGNYEVLNALHGKGLKYQVHLGHGINWELAFQSACLQLTGPVLGVYMPLSNKAFDRIFKNMRTQRGGYLLPANDMRNAMLPFHDQSYGLILVADQSPGKLAKAHWLNFFGRPTPFYGGPEAAARAADLPVVFAYFHKSKRGHYEVICDQPIYHIADMEKGELTRRYVRYLEEKMRLQPEIWLWTHRRWKHAWKEEYGPVLQ
jgi:KDO2-lipid IV(A) lauroyltransferase